MSHRALTLVPAGTMAYDRCLALQQKLHRQVVDDGAGGFLVLVEHPPVLTLGKHADRRHLLMTAATLRSQGVQIVDTDRGGEVTAHEPGQLVVYPILRLADFGLTPRRYIGILEDAVLRTLEGFGVQGARHSEYPGVWVGHEKVCAVGVRIKERVSLHGLALNVTNSLALFQHIVPCGIARRGVTTLARVASCRPDVSVDRAAQVLVAALTDALGVDRGEAPRVSYLRDI